MALLKCPECGKKFSDKAHSCPNCGIPTEKIERIIQCPVCGKYTSSFSKYCRACGHQLIFYDEDNYKLEKYPIEVKKRSKKIYWLFLPIILIIIALLLYLGLIVQRINASQDSNGKRLYTDIKKVASNPSVFKWKYVDFYGRVLGIENDSGSAYLQVYSDVTSYSDTVLVKCSTIPDTLKDDDCVHIEGQVIKSTNAFNLFGVQMTLACIDAESVEEVDYITAAAPTKKTLNVNGELNHNNYIANIDKVEYAEKETRVYFTIKNQGRAKIYIFSNSTKLIQNGKQLEQEYRFEPDSYPEIASEISPGASSSGIFVFPAINLNDSFCFIIEGYSDDFDEEISPYEFNIPAN